MSEIRLVAAWFDLMALPMKKNLIATAALSLRCGSAFARLRRAPAREAVDMQGPKRTRGMIMAVVLALSTSASAREPSSVHRMTCGMVRYYVALYSISAAEQYARSKGASDDDIEAARRCIKTAQADH
jgi:hypothetical protein